MTTGTSEPKGAPAPVRPRPTAPPVYRGTSKMAQAHARSWGLDDVIDYLEGTIQRFYMHNVETLPEELKDYAKLLRKSTKALCAALKEFRNFKKSKKIMGLIDDIAGIEEEGDELFFRSMHDLYANSTNPIQVHVGDMLYQRLENAIDACEHVSDIMGTILLKNS